MNRFSWKSRKVYEAERQAAHDAEWKAYEERLRELYDRHEAEAWKAISENHDSFDKHVLTISGAFLALSISFLKDIIPIGDSREPWILYLSWAAFVIAVVATMFSFLVSNLAWNRHIEFCHQRYLKRDETYHNRRSRWHLVLSGMNWISASAFLLGVVLTVSFCGVNADKAIQLAQQKRTAEATSGQAHIQRAIATTAQPAALSPEAAAAPEAKLMPKSEKDNKADAQ